ncbi:MAG: hypothetical protein C5B51_18675 [Terriglobia bacterium]|nr:MAG: hypothetical protein C5B51_18675 [Terriglobia bacterium]
MARIFRGLLLAVACVFVVDAQWLNYPTKGTPRTAGGKADLTAPAPRRSDGKPDLTGVWMGITKYMINIAADLKPEEVPFQPWAAAEYKRRRDTESRDDPSARCLPLSPPLKQTITSPFKLIDVPGKEEVIMLYEGQRHREIFMDGRPLPKDPEPSWHGYSVGRWDGDDLVVDSIGFNGKIWLDINGHPTTEALHVIERYHRIDFGHMSLEITIDDPKAYTRMWKVKESPRLLPDTELLEAVCENNLDLAHMGDK